MRNRLFIPPILLIIFAAVAFSIYRVSIPAIPEALPSIFELNLHRIELLDVVWDIDWVQTPYKIHYHRQINDVEIYLIGFHNGGLEPYFDVIVELAHGHWETPNHSAEDETFNVVIVNKGDNGLKISVDGMLLAEMETIEQKAHVHWSDEAAYLSGRWLAFNFREIAYP